MPVSPDTAPRKRGGKGLPPTPEQATAARAHLESTPTTSATSPAAAWSPGGSRM